MNAALSILGLKLERIKKQNQMEQKFYSPPSSCQIPELANLYKMFLGEIHDGYFVEVGAFDGVSFSNSSCLIDAGWSGLLIEPVPQFAEMCRRRYQDNDNVTVIECAVGENISTVEISVAEALSTTNIQMLEIYKNLHWSKHVVTNSPKIFVKQRTLDNILDELSPDIKIDVLIIDVEGNEEYVFAGFSLSRWRPRMVVVELTHTHPDLYQVCQSHALLQSKIESEGYTIIFKNAINTVFWLGLDPMK
ncbi:FkbM family methyltransferase [Synechocystis salina LEGE 06099]|nr:FkbM family methyltransferase [Synechocystis salina LEGE 06099]